MINRRTPTNLATPTTLPFKGPFTPSASTSVNAGLRPSTRVDGRRRPSTRVYADMEHMLKSVRVHTKRVYVRRRPLTDVNARRRTYVRLRRVDHPMTSDLVARDKVMNIQFIK